MWCACHQISTYVAGQVDVIQQAWTDADVNPARLGYMETHGTGTAVGDRIEFCPYEDASFQDAAYQGIKIPVNFVTSLLTGKCVEGPIDYLETNLDKGAN